MFSIVLTGGPKAGKTTILDVLRQEYGSRIVIVPEAATGLMANLFPQPGKHCVWTPDWRDSFQRAVLPLQKEMETSWRSVAAANDAEIIVFDRGVLDCAAYLDGGLEELKNLFGIDPVETYSQYDAVIHLETIAVAHPELFDNSDNPQRYEDSPEKAITCDKSLQDVWRAHPHWNFIPSGDTIDFKISAVFEIINSHIDIEHELKFLLSGKPAIDLGEGTPIAQGYIFAEDDEMRVRKIGDTMCIYYKSSGDLSRYEWKRDIPQPVFDGLWPKTEHRRVYKTRYHIHHNGYLLYVDEYQDHLLGLYVVECEFRHPEEASDFVLPDWAEGAIDVTNNPAYKNKNLAMYGLPGDE